MIEPKPYRKRLWSKAAEETRRFWNSYRIGTAIASPIVVTLFWVAIRGWRGWLEVLYAIVLGILIFLSGWGIVFIIGFARAPLALDEESQTVIKRLSQELELPDKALTEHLANLLTQIDQNGENAVRFLLLHGEEAMRILIKPAGLSFDQTSKALQDCCKIGLVKSRVEAGLVGGYNTLYRIPDGYQQTLKRLLFKNETKQF